MNHRLSSMAAAALVVALAPLARAGDAVNYKFSKPPVNSLGITSFEELRGKPVLIDFWGTH
jgi:hypothetical protein